MRINLLKVNQQDTIVTLWRRGWSARKIAREVGFDRDTVSKYIRLETAPKPATPTPGSEGEGGSAQTSPRPGKRSHVEPKPATPSPGNETDLVTTVLAAVRANVSLCEAWKNEIEAGVGAGSFAEDGSMRILVSDHGFAGRYQSVKRFVRRLEKNCAGAVPADGICAGRADAGGLWPRGLDHGRRTAKWRRSHVFRAVPCCSAQAL